MGAGVHQGERGRRTKYLYDGDNVVGDLVSGAFTRQYVTPFLDENLSMTVIGGEPPATYYYNRDGLGSVRNLTDASQVVQNTVRLLPPSASLTRRGQTGAWRSGTRSRAGRRRRWVGR